jgi:hypothetical protein
MVKKIIHWIKMKWLHRHLEEAISQRDRSGVNDPCHTIGFLVDEEIIVDLDQLYQCSFDLNLAPKDVKVFTFLEQKDNLPSLRQNQMHQNDIDWKGQIHHPGALEFLETKFDVLVALYLPGNDFMDLMVAKSQSKFKVGSRGLRADLYDLLIAVAPDNVTDFRTELKKYFTLLNKAI